MTEQARLRGWFSSVRVRLLVLLFLALLPVAIFALYLSHDRQREDFQRAANEVQVLARLTAAAHASVVAQSRQMLVGLTVSNMDPDDPLLGINCNSQMRSVLRMHPIYQQIGMASPDGDVYCVATDLNEPVNLANAPYFRRAVMAKEPSNSGISDTPLTGQKAVVFAQPVLGSDGEVVAVGLAALSLTWLDEHLDKLTLSPDAGAAVLDSKGTIVANFRRPELIGRVVADVSAFKTAIARADEGVMENVGLDGVARILGYARLEGLPDDAVYIRIGLPQAEINEPAIRTLRNTLLAMAIILAAAVVAGWVGGHRLIVQPLAQLTAAAARLGRGDLAARTGMAHRQNEIGILATKFDELAEHVQRSTRALMALSAGNRLLLREKDERQLLASMCRIVIEKGGYRVAWVTYKAGEEDATHNTMASASRDDAAIEAPRWVHNERVDKLIEAVLEGGARRVIEDVLQRDILAPRKEHSLDEPASLAAFPLRVEGEPIGALLLLAAQADAFDGDELVLLDEMADDLSFGISTIRSTAKRIDAERRAERAATHDSLTDLPNASAFVNAVNAQIDNPDLLDEPFSVLVVHLASLQDVYDSLGYGPGDLIVEETARRLRALPALAPTLARISVEDCSAMLVPADARAALLVARSIRDQFQAPIQVGRAYIEVQPAVGASYWPGHGNSADQLIRRATLAAREAARLGLPFTSFKGTPDRENPDRLAVLAELRQAIQQKALTVHYQPKIDLHSGKTVGCEALVRWNHPTRGNLGPAQFVGLAEQTGLIRELTYFVLDETIRQQRRWRSAGIAVPTAVNLSVRNLYDTQLVERIDGLLSTWGVPPNALEFEITESALMEEAEGAPASIATLRRKGCQIYIDDFGTGYSSLSYLVSLPVNALKIDRAFVVQMTESKQAHSVVASIISMAHTLDLEVVAEGVETQSELEELRDLNCDYVQGFLTGSPMPASQFSERFLRGSLAGSHRGT